jgi:hypothetical protein
MTDGQMGGLEGIPNEPGQGSVGKTLGSSTGLLGNVEGWLAGFKEPCGS